MQKIHTSMSSQGICPRWGVEIQVGGHYEYPGRDGDHAELCAYSCPIVNNTMLPEGKKDPRFAEYGFCDRAAECSLLRSFPAAVEVVKEG